MLSSNKLFEKVADSKIFKTATSALVVGSFALGAMAPITDAHANTVEPQVENFFQQSVMHLFAGMWTSSGVFYNNSSLLLPINVSNHYHSRSDFHARLTTMGGAVVGGYVLVPRGRSVYVATPLHRHLSVDVRSLETGVHVITVY